MNNEIINICGLQQEGCTNIVKAEHCHNPDTTTITHALAGAILFSATIIALGAIAPVLSKLSLENNVFEGEIGLIEQEIRG